MRGSWRTVSFISILGAWACGSGGNGPAPVSLDATTDTAVTSERRDAAGAGRDVGPAVDGGAPDLRAADSGTPPVADERPLPPQTGVANVIDFGAKPDDGVDDTAALRAGIVQVLSTQERYARPRFIYLPRGIYDVCGTLEGRVGVGGFGNGWRAGFILVGESRTGTVLRLRDNCEGFGDATEPRAVIATGSERDTPDGDGGGNRAFRHAVMNLTVDVGRGNPGAVGVDFVASNRGTIEDVIIRAPATVGHSGILLTRAWPGPALIKNVVVEGFDHGVRVSHYQYSMTFEHLTLRGQRVVGLSNVQNVLAIRGLRSENSVPAVLATSEHGQIVLVDSELRGGASNATAIVSQGRLLARNLRVEGYGTAIENSAGTKQGVAGTPVTIDEFSSHAPMALWDGTRRSVALPIEETPTFYPTDPAQIIVVPTGGDVQAAIDSGKPVVYLANGHFQLTKTLILRGKLRKLMGFQSSLSSPPDLDVTPLVRFEGGAEEGTILEHLRVQGVMEHASSRTLTLRHMDLERGYRNTAQGTGSLFLEDMIGKPYHVRHPQKVWGRQVNCEFGIAPLFENHGGTVWLLGYKTEGEMTVMRAVGGATEVLGGLFYPLRAVDPATPLLINEGGRASFAYTTNGAPQYRVQLRESRGGQTRELLRADISGRGPGLVVSPAP